MTSALRGVPPILDLCYTGKRVSLRFKEMVQVPELDRVQLGLEHRDEYPGDFRYGSALFDREPQCHEPTRVHGRKFASDRGPPDRATRPSMR